MKTRFIIQILLLLFAISCKDSEQKQEKADFDKKIETELNSGIRNDTVFLGYVFGMDKTGFAKKTKKLIKENKVYINDENNLAYKMTISEDIFGKDLETTFSPEYYQEKLYKLLVSVKPNVGANNELTQLQLVKLFTDKYGFYDYSENSIIDDTKDYFWIDGNRQIEILKGYNDARIFYTDLLAENKAKEIKEANRKKEIESAKNDV